MPEGRLPRPGAPQNRARRRHHFQGKRILSDRLSQRFLQGSGEEGFAPASRHHRPPLRLPLQLPQLPHRARVRVPVPVLIVNQDGLTLRRASTSTPRALAPIFTQGLVTVWLAFLTAAAIEIHRPASLEGCRGNRCRRRNRPRAELLDADRAGHLAAQCPVGLERGRRKSLPRLLPQRQARLSLRAAGEVRARRGEFQPGMCRVWLCWTEGQRRATASLDFTVTRKRRTFVVEPRGGSLGRLPVFRGALATLVPGLAACAPRSMRKFTPLFR